MLSTIELAWYTYQGRGVALGAEAPPPPPPALLDQYAEYYNEILYYMITNNTNTHKTTL